MSAPSQIEPSSSHGRVNSGARPIRSPSYAVKTNVLEVLRQRPYVTTRRRRGHEQSRKRGRLPVIDRLRCWLLTRGVALAVCAHEHTDPAVEGHTKVAGSAADLLEAQVLLQGQGGLMSSIGEEAGRLLTRSDPAQPATSQLLADAAGCRSGARAARPFTGVRR